MKTLSLESGEAIYLVIPDNASWNAENTSINHNGKKVILVSVK